MRTLAQIVLGGVLGTLGAAALNQVVVSDPIWPNAVLFGIIGALVGGMFSTNRRPSSRR